MTLPFRTTSTVGCNSIAHLVVPELIANDTISAGLGSFWHSAPQGAVERQHHLVIRERSALSSSLTVVMSREHHDHACSVACRTQDLETRARRQLLAFSLVTPSLSRTQRNPCSIRRRSLPNAARTLRHAARHRSLMQSIGSSSSDGGMTINGADWDVGFAYACTSEEPALFRRNQLREGPCVGRVVVDGFCQPIDTLRTCLSVMDDRSRAISAQPPHPRQSPRTHRPFAYRTRIDLVVPELHPEQALLDARQAAERAARPASRRGSLRSPCSTPRSPALARGGSSRPSLPPARRRRRARQPGRLKKRSLGTSSLPRRLPSRLRCGSR